MGWCGHRALNHTLFTQKTGSRPIILHKGQLYKLGNYIIMFISHHTVSAWVVVSFWNKSISPVWQSLSDSAGCSVWMQVLCWPCQDQHRFHQQALLTWSLVLTPTVSLTDKVRGTEHGKLCINGTRLWVSILFVGRLSVLKQSAMF